MDFSFDEQFHMMIERLTEKGICEEKNRKTSCAQQQVVLLGHMNPDGDAAGSVMALAHYIRINYPGVEVLPYLSEKLDKGPKLLVKEDAVLDPFRKPELQQSYGVIVCDTATRARMIGLEYYEKAAASIVLDHHASNEGYGDVNFTKISESCAANVFGTLDPDKLARAAEETHPNAADYLYLGILHDTGGFARADCDIMSAAAALLRLGVDHRQMMRTLNTMTMEDKHREAMLLEMARRADTAAPEMENVASAPIAYVIVDRECAEKNHISYEDIHPISGTLRDCEDIELGFTMYEEEPDIWRCSFRSDGKWINVNELLTPFGGGGHAGAAGLRTETKDQPDLLKKILDRVRELRGD